LLAGGFHVESISPKNDFDQCLGWVLDQSIQCVGVSNRAGCARTKVLSVVVSVGVSNMAVFTVFSNRACCAQYCHYSELRWWVFHLSQSGDMGGSFLLSQSGGLFVGPWVQISFCVRPCLSGASGWGGVLSGGPADAAHVLFVLTIC
jgi:uncharacterized membrane protein YtjA (UPF0391 family)